MIPNRGVWIVSIAINYILEMGKTYDLGVGVRPKVHSEKYNCRGISLVGNKLRSMNILQLVLTDQITFSYDVA
jgi:hypothetical protein